jgi:MATE family multidrug resistance protein
MVVNLAEAVINGVLDYCLIFGPGPFPQWGIGGAAVATVTANVVAVAIYAVLMLTPRVEAEYHVWRHRRFDRTLFGRLIHYGLPNGLTFLLDVAGFSLFILVIGLLGQHALAATNLAFNMNSLAFVPMLGLGTAVMVIVGRRVGEGRPQWAVRTTWIAFTLSGAWMIAFAAIYLFLPGPILALYAFGSTPEDFAALHDEAIVLLRFVAVYSFFDAMGIVFGSALRGAGDTRFSLVFSFLTGWLLMVLPVVIAWQAGRNSLTFAWTACTVYIIVVGVGFLLRFLWGPWKSMRVIEPVVGDVIEETSD